MRRPLHQLTRQEHSVLHTWGFLIDLYPQATGDWTKDSQKPKSTTDWSDIFDVYAHLSSTLTQVIDQAPVLSDLFKTPYEPSISLDMNYEIKLPEKQSPQPDTIP